MMDGGAVSSQPRFEPPQRFEPTLQQIPSSERSEVLAPEEVANHTPPNSQCLKPPPIALALSALALALSLVCSPSPSPPLDLRSATA